MSQSAVHGILLNHFVFKSCKYELLQDVTTEDEARCGIFQNLKQNFFRAKTLFSDTHFPSVWAG